MARRKPLHSKILSQTHSWRLRHKFDYVQLVCKLEVLLVFDRSTGIQCLSTSLCIVGVPCFGCVMFGT